MQWWFTVLFVIGNGMIFGEPFEGWNAKAYLAGVEHRAVNGFAELQATGCQFDHETRLTSSVGPAVTKSPSESMESDWENGPWPLKTQWHEQPDHLGLDDRTFYQMTSMGPDGVALRYEGPLKPPLAEELRNLLLTSPQRFMRVVLELDSNGGDLAYVKEIVDVLRQVRSRAELTTRVMEGAICASGCIPVFMQGEKRKASGASVWVFHGARRPMTNIPNPVATRDYLEILSSSGLEPAFRAELEQDNRIYSPGSLILSGYEVFHVNKTGIITELLPTWRQEKPVLPNVTPSN